MKIILNCAIVLLVGCMTLLTPAWARDVDYSLIIAPARFSVMQVMFDVIDRRPAVLMSYQGEATTENPALHVWNGSWNPVGLHDLREGSFLRQSPSRVILIGDDALLPSVLRDSVRWLPPAVVIRDIRTAGLLNELGRVLNWSRSEWRWFAQRYRLTIEDEAAPLRRESWYDQPGPIVRETGPGAPIPPQVAGPAPQEPLPVLPALLPPPDIPEAPKPVAPLPEPMPEPAPLVEVEPSAAAPAQASRSLRDSGDLNELITTLEQQLPLTRAPGPAPTAAPISQPAEAAPVK